MEQENRLDDEQAEQQHRPGGDGLAEASTNGEETAPPLAFPVVGIGASAGGLEAFQRFFRHMPDDSGMAFVLVQHLSPDHESELAELLQNHTRMKVAQVDDAPELQPNHVYVIPPGKNLTIQDGQLHLSEPERQRGHRAPIDYFFRSLAEDQGENAVCIVLSGTGSDGTLGLKAIKERAGVTMAQEPDDAEYDGMPKSAVRTGLVDLVGTAEGLAEKLVQYRNSALQIQLPEQVDALPEDDTEALARIFARLREETGHDFTHYKRSTILRRIGRRLQVHQIESLTEYLQHLRRNKEEVQALFKDFLISVTNFFRDPDAFERLDEEVLPQLFENPPEQVRVWVAGCATGEEAYSIAMLLCEHASRLEHPPDLQVFATDLDAEAIAFAREGLYPDAIAADVSAERLRRFFTEEGHGYRVGKDIREIVLFAVHNLIKDPPFSRLDLISCRNLLIYLDREVQENVLGLFHYALRTDGHLFLGSSGSAESASDLFITLDKKHRLYRRRNTATSQARFPAAPVLKPNRGREANGQSDQRSSTREALGHQSLEDAYQVWTLRRYAPPRLVVDENYNITYVFGEAGRYLEDKEGPVTQNVLDKIAQEMRIDLRTALYQSLRQGKRVTTRFMRLEAGGAERVVRLHIGPVDEPGFPKGYVEVVFEEIPAEVLDAFSVEVPDTDHESGLAARLEDELQTTKRQLQATIEEQETSNEELKASNEELQSMNEELQSTTEELETSKEELQSMNEELVTVNQELRTKIEELSRANSDLQNLMDSTQTPTLFLDRDLHLVRYTPQVTGLFHIIPSDMGRPLKHVSHKLDADDLVEEARSVLEKLTRVEREVQDDEGHWYVMRMLPYRTEENRIDGVVITFAEVTRLKRVQGELDRRMKQQEAVARLGRVALEGTDLDALMDETVHRVANVLRVPLCKVLELTPDGDRLLLKAGVGWQEGYVGEVYVPSDEGSQAGYTLKMKRDVIMTRADDEIRFSMPDLLKDHEVVSGMSVIISGPERAYGVLGAHSTEVRTFTKEDAQFLQAAANVLGEATARKRAEAELAENAKTIRDQLAEIHAIYNAAPVGLAFLDQELRYRRINKQMAEINGLDVEAHLGRSIREVLPALADDVEPLLERIFETGEALHEIEVTGTVPRDPETERTWLCSYVPQVMEDGEVQGINTVVRDVTDAKQAEEALRKSEARLRRQTEELEMIYRRAPIGFVLLGRGGRILKINEYLAGIDGAPVEEHLGETGPEMVPQISDQVMPLVQHVLETGEPVLNREIHGSTPGHPDEERVFLVSYSPIRDQNGDVDMVSGVVLDITERKRNEEALEELTDYLEERVAERTDQVQRLASELTLAEQSERRRIAQILHDDLQQLLYGMQIKLALVGDELADANVAEAVRREVGKLNTLTDTALKTTRTLAVDLSPPVLKGEGLDQSLQWLALQMEEVHGLKVSVDGEGRVPNEDMHVLIFQLVRELLFNVVKHSGVNEADVRLWSEENMLIVEVHDDGKGFDPKKLQALQKKGGFGLFSIRERLRLFGGHLEARSIPGDGSRMTIYLPRDATNQHENA